jgi:DNA-binding beta-propeller fold protein YncE
MEAGMKRWTLNFGLLLAFGLVVAGCGSGSASSTATTTITLSVTGATVAVGSTFSFVASVVTSNTNQAVNWQVNSIPGGNSTVGTIDVNGNYTAPTTVPVPDTVTVTAIAQADTTITASAIVTIDSGIRVAVTPTSATIGTGESLSFTPTVTGTSAANQGVTWIVCQSGSISTVTASTAPCPADTTGALGSVSATGIYKAPPIVPTANPVAIEAVSVKDPNQFALAAISLQAALDPTMTSVYPTRAAQGSIFVDVVIQGTNMITTTDVIVNSVSLTNFTGATIASFGGVLRARVPASFFATAPGVLQIQLARQAKSGQAEIPVGCTPTPSVCSIAVDPERPAIVSSAPASAFEHPTGLSGGSVPFTVDGGYFGTNLLSQFDGGAVSAVVAPRSVSVSLPSSAFLTPGLHQISLTNPSVTTPAVLPETTTSVNIAVQPCIGTQTLCSPESGEPVVTTASLPLGGTSPSAIAVNTATGVAVIANKTSNDLTLVDLTVSPPVLVPGGRIPVGNGPTGVAVDNVRNVAVVANNTDKTISVVNLATRAVTTVATQIPAAPLSVGVNPITGIALIAYQNTNIGALVDLTQTPPVFVGAVTLTTGANPHVAVMPGLNWGLVTGGGLGIFSIVDLQRRNSNLIGAGGAVRVSSTSTVTITTTLPHSLISGDAVLLQGVSDASFNGIFVVASVPSANSFTLTQTGADSTSGGGTVFYSRPLATVSLSQNVTGVAVNEETKQAVITDPTNQASVTTMSVLDQTITPINLQSGDIGVAVNQYTDTAVSINPTTLLASILDMRAPKLLTTVTLQPGTNPSAIAIDPGTNQALIVNQGTNDMTVISLGAATKPLQLESVVLPVNRQLGTDLTLASTSPLPLTLIGKGFVSAGSVVARLDGFALTPVGIVTDRQMSVVVPASLLTSPRRFAVDVISSSPGSIPSNVEGFSVIQPVDLTSAACPSPSPGAVAIDDVLNFAIVTQNNCNSVALVNLATGTVSKTVAVGASPQGVASYPGGGTAVVTNRGDNTATVLDIADTTQTPVVIITGVEPLGVAIDPTTGIALVTNSNTNSNSITSFTATLAAASSTVATSAASGSNPVAVAIDTVNQKAVVANASSGSVTILDTSQSPPGLFGAISGLSQPSSVAFDPVNSVFMVTSSLGNAIFFIDAQQSQSSAVRVGINPTAVAYNYLTSTIVTVNSISSTISVLDINDGKVHANLGLKASQLGSIAIHPRTNIASIVDSQNNRLLLVPLPN